METLGHRLSFREYPTEEADRVFRGIHVLLEDWHQED